MCDFCTDVLILLDSHDERVHSNVGLQLNKREIQAVMLYVGTWAQRQCMCCYKDFKNIEKLNNLIQTILRVAIRLIQTLPTDIQKEFDTVYPKDEEEKNKSVSDVENEKEEKVEEKEEKSEEPGDENEYWSMDEKEKLIQFITNVFLMNFPLYMAYKHFIHTSLEELSQQETGALNNYCEISDPDVPLYLLRNVCFFCDTNGIQSLEQCFEKATPETLPFNFSHLLIRLIANLRLWMNIPTVMQCIIPLRSAVIRYMCSLSDRELRNAGSRNMTELMWAAVKEPLENHFSFDKEGLQLGFKYFTCTTLTIRLAGIAQINNQINLYNESCNNETFMDAESVGNELAQWLIENKIIEHIFGPNLHVEIIKQSQMILNFLAMEGRITSEHIDCIWATSQLKHCGKQVYDILIPLIKNLHDLTPVRHLLKLVSSLDISAHTESTLFLASALIKCMWNTCASGHGHCIPSQQVHPQLQSTYSALQREREGEDALKGKHGKHGISSSEDSDGGTKARMINPKPCCSALNTEELELGECCPHHHLHHSKPDTGDSDSSMDGNSDLSVGSEDSGGEESDARFHHKNSKFRLESKVKLVEESDSDVDGSDSSCNEGKSKEKRKGMKRLRKVTVMRLVRNEDNRTGGETHSEDSCLEDCRHCHDEELEEGESEFIDSEDEKEIEEAELARIKQACQEDSEESSELEVDEQKVKRLHGMSRYQQRQALSDKQKAQAMLHRAMLQARVCQSDDEKPGTSQQYKSENMSKVEVEETKEASSSKDRKINIPNLEELTSSQKSDQDMIEAAAVIEASGDGQVTSGKSDVEVYDCREVIQHLQKSNRNRNLQCELSEDIMSPDDGSCHSSRMSTKSEKNMADFDGEEGLSDEELVQISANARFNSQQMQEHIASMYSGHVPRAVIHHRPSQREISVSQPSSCDVTFDDVCKKGNTLLWDLVQEDAAHLLPEGLAVEAEKALYSLVCVSTDKRIKLKFIAACIENVANHRSVVISLRLLPRIFDSFPNYRIGCSYVTMWAENELNMMEHFFNDLVHYTQTVKEGNTSPNALYCHREEVLVRLQFLICVFSTYVSPDSFRLSEGQVDILWNCLAADKECSDDCLHWFLNQAKNKDFHALGVDTFKHIFLEKMPQLEPESTSMISLNLFQQLSHLARYANPTSENPLSEDQLSGMNQLWNIALRARNKDVSLSAIQYINNYYIGYGQGSLDKEEEFVKLCMKSLVEALSKVREDAKGSLLILQRGLTLLKNHLEGFRRRYAFHLRNWQIDGNGIHGHQQHRYEKPPTAIRIHLQPAGMSEKTQIEMLSTDLVADLRAEVARWWEEVQKQQQIQREQPDGSHGAQTSPILGSMLHDGPIRMITFGQELTVDTDEKTIGEMQFKDMQLVFVSVGASRQAKKMDGSVPASSLTAPNRDKLPMILLLQEPHFDNLFMLLEQLSNLDTDLVETDCREITGLQAEARRLSRSVWELLMILPTSQKHLDGFKSIMSTQSTEEEKAPNVDWNNLLPPSSPHRLYYSLQIVEFLSHSSRMRRKSVMRSGGGDAYVQGESDGLDSNLSENVWSSKFISKGGLSHLFNIFMTGSLQPKEGDVWSQWNQECLAYLLRLMSQFAVGQADTDSSHDDDYESPRKKIKKQKGMNEKIIIPRLNQSTVNDLNVESVLKILMQILYEAALPEDNNQLYLGSWGRTEVVHYALSFLVSLAYSCDEVHCLLCTDPTFTAWLKRLTLEAPEPYVRKEACMGLYKLCLGKTVDDKSGYNFTLPILSNLLDFLADSLLFKPQKTNEFEGQKEKEAYGPGCKDYFFLVCRFVENISREDAKKEDGPLDLNSLAKTVSQHLTDRCIYESRFGVEEDDGLVGLLQLCTAIMKHDPPFKHSNQGQMLLEEIFSDLFSLPSPSQRNLPKCKSQSSRSAAYDLIVELVKGSVDNYNILHAKMMEQHSKDSHTAYPWDYWPHEDGRSKCGYVGLTNLGATCYMATCMQHLYMIPQARESVLRAKCTGNAQHEGTLIELQKMFAYLQESERKAYNPKSFCKAYTMDKQPLNTGEQKDMTEFFTDLISKLEEMSPDMRKLVKTLFGGVLTNNVVSLDCPHVSRTFEEFYTVRCQVTDMKDLYESLDEVTVKDMLEGDNMYTCSKCVKKVRAEKRACFRKLPKILCFNTMRYTFNMITMMKEKVNTHFSFPLRLDMSPYMESNLMGPDRLKDSDDFDGGLDCEEFSNTEDISCEYELIGVTVHTGTADGGHYYSFIRDRLNKGDNGHDKWFLFNDAEVKPFDPTQIASECFGGEMTSKTYDSVTDKFMDFSFEKTNSAYMLFYESCPPKKAEDTATKSEEPVKFNFDLSNELGQWIWQDNTQFLQDKNLFEHSYFGFMWQICGYIPTTLVKDDVNQVALKAAQLSLSFVLETMIHSKEKPTMLQWIELLTKQFNSCPKACEWSLDHMAESDWWPQQILIKCPNQMVRQMFQRLVLHVIAQLRSTQVDYYMQPIVELEDGTIDVNQLGNRSCVTRFIRKMLTIIEHGVRPHSKYLTEYFAFLLEFAKSGEEEAQFLIHINAISTMITFYMGQKAQENYVEILSDDEEEEDVISLTDDNYRPIALEKMITLIALLVEKSRTNEKQLRLSAKDTTAIIGGKGFPFLFNQIRDSINIRQTCNLMFSLTRWNENQAMIIVNMIFNAIKKLTPEQSQPFFKLLSMLVEFIGGPPGMPQYTRYILHKFWDLAKCCPQQCLEWLAGQVTRNKVAQAWCLSQMDMWVEQYLIAHNTLRVRNAAAYLLVALVPNHNFRQAYRPRNYHSPLKELVMPADARLALTQIYEHLLSLLSRAKAYVDPHVHSTTKLTSYFAVLTYCLNSKTEKLMFSDYFQELWHLFHPKLSEPQISMHHNKQVLLLFWHQVCVDCPENIQLIVSNPHVSKNIAFNYILADHEDQDVVMFNKVMLPSYYGLLRMCCQQDRNFTRQLAQHQNIQWAFKNITPYPTQYTMAVEELFKMMKLMAAKPEESTSEELRSINTFRHSTLSMYLSLLDARSMWQTLISAFKILVESQEEKLEVVLHGGLQMITEAFYTLHVMFHEATACHVTGDIVDLLTILLKVLETSREIRESRNEISGRIKGCFAGWKERMEFVKKVLTLLNSYTPPEVRQVCFELLKQMVLTFQGECIATIVPVLTHAHTACQDNSLPVVTGPYFPKRGQKPFGSKSNIRPPRPQFQMCLNTSQIEHCNGVDDTYDQALKDFFQPYHMLVDVMCRVAVNQQNMSEALINLSAMVACEGVPLQLQYFAMLWYEIYQSEQVDRNYIKVLCNSNAFIDYVDAVLLDERRSLNSQCIYQFFCNFFPKVYQQVLHDQGRSLLDSIVASIIAEKSALENVEAERELQATCYRINADVRAMLIIFSVQMPKQISTLLMESLQYILKACRQHQQQRLEAEEQVKLASQKTGEESPPSTDKKPESDETPSKRRRISNDDNEEEDKGEEKSSTKTSEASSADDRAKEDKSSPEEVKPSPKPSASQPSTSTNQPSTSSGSSSRPHQSGLLFNRDKPNKVDLAATQIQKLLNLIEKKSKK